MSFKQVHGIVLSESLIFSENDVFNPRDEVPFAKIVSLLRSGPFHLDAHYAQPNCVPHNQVHIGSWNVVGARPGPDNNHQKVKVKVRVSPDGVFSIANATMYEPKIVEELPEVPMEVDGNTNPDAPPAEPQVPVKKTKMVPVELEVVETTPVSYDIAKYHDMELRMQASDEKERSKADAKNSLEEYVYEMREKIADQYADFITEADAEQFRSQLTAMEDWLYDEGEDAEKAEYEEKLNGLKTVGEPVSERFREYEHRKPAFDQFDTAILRVRKAYEDYANGGPTYAHLDSKDMEKVINAIEDKKKWLDEARHKQETRPKTDAPVVFTEDIWQQKTVSFENPNQQIVLISIPGLRQHRQSYPEQEKASPATSAEEGRSPTTGSPTAGSRRSAAVADKRHGRRLNALLDNHHLSVNHSVSLLW